MDPFEGESDARTNIANVTSRVTGRRSLSSMANITHITTLSQLNGILAKSDGKVSVSRCMPLQNLVFTRFPYRSSTSMRSGEHSGASILPLVHEHTLELIGADLVML